MLTPAKPNALVFVSSPSRTLFMLLKAENTPACSDQGFAGNSAPVAALNHMRKTLQSSPQPA